MAKGKPKRVKQEVPAGGWQPRKQALAVEPVDTSKTPVVAPAPDTDVLERCPVWRFSGADLEGVWAVQGLADGDVLEDVLDKMADFESMTIKQLFHTGGHPGKLYEVSELPDHAHGRLVEISRDDEDRIARLRLTGTQRLYGFLRGHVFHVLWWDPDHKVWPSTKKHT